MTFQRFLTFVLYAAIITGAVGHVGYLWRELTVKERVELCVMYGAVIVALGLVIF